jgi:hypothetical protein
MAPPHGQHPFAEVVAWTSGPIPANVIIVAGPSGSPPPGASNGDDSRTGKVSPATAPESFVFPGLTAPSHGAPGAAGLPAVSGGAVTPGTVVVGCSGK